MPTDAVAGEPAQRGFSRAEFFRKVEDYERALSWILVRDDRHSLKLSVPSRICLQRALVFFEKEPETLRWIAGFPEGAVMFDVGANVGSYTLWAALTRNATVYAFEPEAGNYSTLNVNLRLNGLTDRCQAYCMGIKDTVGLETLRLQPRGVGGSGHQVASGTGTAVGQGIPVTTLDHLVYEAGLPCPQYLKIDVDGLEPAIVRGAPRLLADDRLRSILVELAVKDAEHRAVMDVLKGCGFEMDEELARSVFEKNYGVAYTGNVIFTRP